MFPRRARVESTQEGAERLLEVWQDKVVSTVEAKGTAFGDGVFVIPLRVASPRPGSRVIVIEGGPMDKPGSLGEHFASVKKVTGPLRVVRVEKIED